MRIPILLAGLAIMALSTPVAAEDPESAASCLAGERPIHRFPAWADKSDAICDYGFVEVNRRLADLLEAPSGAVNIEWLKKTLGVPRFIQREGYEPNGFFVVNAGYQVALAGQDGWEMVIEAYERRREGAWGRKDDFNVKFHGMGLNPQMEAANKGRCISEAAMLDRAIAAGWRYVPGGMESGTAGPIFMPGGLVNDDGRTLVLINLSRTTELPPRETLEATCAWIFSFSELKQTPLAAQR
ncbi:hypothetical protein [Sphingopyxis sp.]|uniref:hypothetical protein n=1 Tax=Sphingopyxis sp. TaxID=1908224 RepID=UPI003D0B805D